MTRQTERELLEDVLDAFVASGAGPNGSSLTEWIRRYPRYEPELTDFAASWSLMRHLPPAPDAEQVDEETLVLRGMSVAQNLLYEAEQAALAPPIQSLLEEGRARGLTPHQLARAAGIGDMLLRKLDRHLIRYASIPRAMIERLATATQREVEGVAQYLQQGPISAAYAVTRLSAVRDEARLASEDFFAAVRGDPTMTEEERTAWLDLEPRTRCR